MRYMLLVCGEESPEDDPGMIPSAVPGEPDEPCHMPWAREMAARGVLLLEGSRLQTSRTATSVRASGGDVLVADGPFAETKEQILGYSVIECADLDEAIYAASRHPVAQQGGVVEVRPIRAS
jgi:hypothetical protein